MTLLDLGTKQLIIIIIIIIIIIGLMSIFSCWHGLDGSLPLSPSYEL